VQVSLAIAVLLAATGCLALLARALWRAAARRGAGEAGPLATVAEGVGLLAAEIDREGRIVSASPGLRALGAVPGAAVAEALGDELAILRRGAGAGLRGATAGRIAVPGRGPAQAAVVRAARRAVVLLRPLWREPVPPPLPRPAPPLPARSADLGAAGRSVLPAVERAATAAALLRLTLPSGSAARELTALELALADAERRLRALAAGGGGRPMVVDLSALVAGLLGGGGFRAELPGHPVLARADPLRVRTALREVLGSARGGRDLTVAVRDDRGGPVVELTSAGGVGDEAVALAEALLGPEGVRVALAATPSGVNRRSACRLSFPGAGPDAPAPRAAEVGRGAEPLTPGRAGQ
jgi:hypothetical protein